MIVVVVVVAAVQVYRAHGSSTGGSTVVLIPGQSETPISAEQLAAVDFSLSGPGSLNGTYSTVRAVTFYIMTPAEYEYFALKNALDGYTWIYNASADTEKAYLEIQVQTAGEWVFAMYNANATTATAVGWITPLTLTT